MQHMLYHLAPDGVMATVLANGSLSSNTSGEGDIRGNIVKADLVDCIVALPKQLFYNTGIPATIWILRRARTKRQGETLFIDASEMGFMQDRVHREFSADDIQTIEDTYHHWRQAKDYQDIKGYCKSATLADIEKHSHVLTPGRYVGIPDEEDDGIPFDVKMKDLTTTLAGQIEQEKVLDAQLKEQLAKIGFGL
jgi:type I restriction enzyme M protein